AASRSDRQASAEEACRLTTALLQVRLEIIAPSAVDLVPRRVIDALQIDDDLARVVIREIVETGPSTVFFDGLVRALGGLLEPRWIQEQTPGGLWRRLSAHPRLHVLEARVEERLEELLSRAGWAPMEPALMETLRSSVPLKAR